LSLPLVSGALASLSEKYGVLTTEQLKKSSVQAIVILGGGKRHNAPEFGGVTASDHTLKRVRYGARLHRITGLPLLVTGGKSATDRYSEAEVMSRILKEEYGILPRWEEKGSRDTFQNAQFSVPMLKKGGVKRIYLVTTAMHLARAVPLFEELGLEVVPAPTSFEGLVSGPLRASDFVPDSDSLAVSRYALHELMGRVYYALRY
ncbi:MAG: YdcF family protein, partial [Gammaproteobacteria bacterium]|nr:YdcF family protein [Gammaproteobacteria bacterium]